MIAHMKSELRRAGVVDVLIAVLMSAVAIPYMIADVNDDTIDASPWAVAPFLAITVPLLWRRTAPIAALAAVLVGLLIHAALFGDIVRCGIVIPVAWLMVFPAGSRRDRRPALLGLALALAFLTVMTLTDGPEGAPIEAMTFLAPMTLLVWGIGRLVHSRAAMIDQLEARTSELRRARDERARLEVAGDRARLSADLDELLQRRLEELAALADSGARNGDADAAVATLAEIERDSRRTLEEMREVVGVLRHDDAPMAPQPTLTHLEALLVRSRGAGASLRVEGRPRALPAGLELSAYRVVECLLDALADADGVEVCVRFADDALELNVAGPAKRRGDEAIERARERVKLNHGTLAATTSRGRSEAVVSLPIYATV